MQTFSTLKIAESDTVAVAIKALTKGEVVEVGDKRITLASDIPAGHKFA
ncbi:MAG TPA: hypothetical protein DCG32_02420, partial [Sphaerochaeta sp.]|nr:hypothetical protein [Sphaerochaeta sp.]